MAVDLVIKNCRVVLPTGIMSGGVAIENGRISKVGSDSVLPSTSNSIDGGNQFLLPGTIDSHVHFREPGYEYKEDFHTGSMAAAAGAVTTVIDMPSGIPYIDSPENLLKKFELVKGRSFVDYGQNCMIADYNLDALAKMVQLGAIGFKLYMSKTAVQVSVANDATILEAFKGLAEIDAPTSVHAENDSIISYHMEKVKASGEKTIISYARGRPKIAECEAIQRASLFSLHAGNRIHILHLSSGEGLDQIAKWKSLGTRLTAETCPHYLLLDPKELQKAGSLARINPPIRADERNVASLWDGINDGVIDTIGSDHSPHKFEEKSKDDVWDAASGFNGVETLVPLMLTQVKKGKLLIEKYAKLTSENPAKIFGLFPRKGSVQIGSDADLVLATFEGKSVIRSDRLKSKTKVTPFDGWELSAYPTKCFLRGQLIMEENEVIGKPAGEMVVKR